MSNFGGIPVLVPVLVPIWSVDTLWQSGRYQNKTGKGERCGYYGNLGNSNRNQAFTGEKLFKTVENRDKKRTFLTSIHFLDPRFCEKKELLN